MISHLTSDDVLLLKSALLDGQKARLAYEAWRPSFDFEATDYGQQRLLPLLQQNLSRLGISDPLMPRLRGIRHYFWARNQIRLQAVAPVLAALRSTGAPCMILKGAALLASCLKDTGLRPMDDIDALIPKEYVATAVDILSDHGFQPISVPRWSVTAVVTERLPGIGFVDGSGQQIDLHWHMLALDQRPIADDAFWSGARPVQISGVELVAPGFVHQVLHTLVHAAEWNPTSTLRWASDALTILRAAGPGFDWDQLVADAMARRLAFPIWERLTLLARDLDVPVPVSALKALERDSRASAVMEFGSRAIPPHHRSLLRRLWVDLFDFRRRRIDLMQRSVFSSLGPFVTERLGARGLSRQTCLLIFGLLNRPRWLRRVLRVDTLIRRIDADSLPSLGQAIDLLNGPEGLSALVDGWSIPELTGCWTLGLEARLAWRVQREMTFGLRCHIDALILLPPVRPAPRIEIWVNDRFIKYLESHRDTASVASSFDIPAFTVANSDILVLTFVIRGALSPAQAGVSTDPRKLGLHLRRIAITPVKIPAADATAQIASE